MVSLAGCAGADAGGRVAQGGAAQRAATGFLGSYVRPDGRVTRPDQGGDTVSEGQAYGMLLAEVAGRPAEFSRIWRWTREHLQLPSGLFAYHANAAGHVLSREPASDADLLIAWALLRYQGPAAATWHRDGRRVLAAILAHEVTTGPGSMPVLAAGPWATGRPASLNPSYWSLPALTGLARLTGNPRWQRLASDAVSLAGRLTGGGRALPPDWAQLTATGLLAPEPAPNGSQPQTQYGLDAQRTVVWFAVSCQPRARALAARWWALLRPGDRAQAQALHPDGAVLDPAPAPLPLVAAAAGAWAAGQRPAASRLLRQASSQQHRYPTYYGGAWVALGTALLSGALASPC
ncbi:MAG: glycosyl hydrolase family 8 [Streptosporangiaceae bacterium]